MNPITLMIYFVHSIIFETLREHRDGSGRLDGGNSPRDHQTLAHCAYLQLLIDSECDTGTDPDVWMEETLQEIIKPWPTAPTCNYWLILSAIPVRIRTSGWRKLSKRSSNPGPLRLPATIDWFWVRYRYGSGRLDGGNSSRDHQTLAHCAYLQLLIDSECDTGTDPDVWMEETLQEIIKPWPTAPTCNYWLILSAIPVRIRTSGWRKLFKRSSNPGPLRLPATIDWFWVRYRYGSGRLDGGNSSRDHQTLAHCAYLQLLIDSECDTGTDPDVWMEETLQEIIKPWPTAPTCNYWLILSAIPVRIRTSGWRKLFKRSSNPGPLRLPATIDWFWVRYRYGSGRLDGGNSSRDHQTLAHCAYLQLLIDSECYTCTCTCTGTQKICEVGSSQGLRVSIRSKKI